MSHLTNARHFAPRRPLRLIRRKAGGVICRSFQTNDGTRPKNSWAKSAQKPITLVSCLLTSEAHHVAFDPKGRRVGGRQELHRAWMDHVGGELGIVGAHGKAFVEFLAFKADLLATPAAAHREQGKVNGIRTAVTISEWSSVTVRVWLRPSESV